MKSPRLNQGILNSISAKGFSPYELSFIDSCQMVESFFYLVLQRLIVYLADTDITQHRKPSACNIY